jgi:hypothetical protein
VVVTSHPHRGADSYDTHQELDSAAQSMHNEIVPRSSTLVKIKLESDWFGQGGPLLDTPKLQASHDKSTSFMLEHKLTRQRVNIGELCVARHSPSNQLIW